MPIPRWSVVAPPVIQLAIRGAHYNFEVARRSVVPLNEPRDTHCVARTEDAAICPLAGCLIEEPVMQAVLCGEKNHLEISVVGRTGQGGGCDAVVTEG